MDISGIIYAYKPEGYSVKEVHSEFEEGGRWTNYETEVFKIECDGKVAYFEMWREVPTTEMQEGGFFTFFTFGFYEVVPQEVTVTQYVAKEGGQ